MKPRIRAYCTATLCPWMFPGASKDRRTFTFWSRGVQEEPLKTEEVWSFETSGKHKPNDPASHLLRPDPRRNVCENLEPRNSCSAANTDQKNVPLFGSLLFILPRKATWSTETRVYVTCFLRAALRAVRFR